MVLVDDRQPSTSRDSTDHLGVGGACLQPLSSPSKPLGSTYDWDPDATVMPRSGRSQSLTLAPTTLDRQLSTTEIASAPTVRSVAFAAADDSELALHRQRMRRTKSADLLSLSLLQQELGYPRARVDSSSTSPQSKRNLRGSRRSRHSVARVEEADCGKEEEDANSASRPAATSDAPTVVSTECDEDDGGDHVGDHEEEGENFMDSRWASVTGYARDTDGITYYEIVVESTAHGPLSAYKVRRRYSEFRQLHRALARVMPTRPPRNQGLGRNSVTSSGYSFDSELPTTRSHSKSLDAADSSAEQLTSSRRLNANSWLPPLPDHGGMWSFFQGDNPTFLETRARGFHAIVVAAQQHPAARASRLLNKFLGPPPDSFANTTYVSLNRFAAPTLRFSIEIQERKEVARTIQLKRRQSISH